MLSHRLTPRAATYGSPARWKLDAPQEAFTSDAACGALRRDRNWEKHYRRGFSNGLKACLSYSFQIKLKKPSRKDPPHDEKAD
jgi:hypothetical protein